MLGLEKRFEVKDGPRRISFVGWELASADSTTTGSEARWTELVLFKTRSGRYVLQKVGRSDVFHNERCSPRKGWTRYDDLYNAMPDDVSPDDEIDVVFIPCENCKPAYDDQPVWVESDYYQATTFGTPEAVLEALYRPDTANTTRYLSRVARALLEQACDKDDKIREVMTKPVDVT